MTKKTFSADLFQAAVAVYIEHAPSGKMLILERKPAPGRSRGWEVVHGRLEADEKWEDALRREVAEETGLTNLTELKLVSTWSLAGPARAGKKPILGVSFWGQTTQSEIKISDEHQAFAWQELAQVRAQLGERARQEDFDRFLAFREEWRNLSQAEERAKRAHADFHNALRRQQEERARFALLAGQEILSQIVEPLDHLWLASNQLRDAGLDLVVKQLFTRLAELGLEVIDPLGQEFAVETMEAIEKKGEGKTVKTVLSRGYRFHEQVLRYAKVVVG